MGPRSTRTIPILVLIASWCWFESEAKGNLTSNGNFSSGTFTESFGTATDILPVDWALDPPSTASTSNINVIASMSGIYADPLGSSDYVAFDSAATSGQDCLWQSIPTVAGQTYIVSFYAAMTGSSVANTFLTAEWDQGGAHDTDMGGMLFSSTSGAATDGFIHFQFTEIASSNSTVFFFHSTDANGPILVADLSVTQQSSSPEPGSLLLISAGLLILGAVRRCRRLRLAQGLRRDPWSE